MNRRTLRRLVLVGLVAAVAATITAVTGHAAASREGEVLFNGGSTTSGGSATVSLGVPTGAACQGSGPSGYRWETFLVSEGVDVAGLTFASGPNPVSGEFVVPLYDLNLLQVSTKFPASNPLGLISGVPAISLSNTVDGNGLASLPIGRYQLGIACTFGGAVQEYWSVYLEVTSNPQDTPLGIAWTVVAASTPTTTTTTTTTTTVVSSSTSTTTSDPGATTSTTTDPSVDGSTTSTLAIFGSGSEVPETGASSSSVLFVAIAVLVAGRFVILSVRRVKVLPPS